MRLVPAIVLLSTGCGGAATCDLTGLAEGAVRGTVDGVGWDTTGAAWSPTGEGIQVVTSSGGGYRVTFSLLKSVDGEALATAVDAGETPIEVSFDDESAGFALLYADGASGSLTSKGDGGGTLTIERLDGDLVGACFAFDAVSADRTASVEGALLAAPL